MIDGIPLVDVHLHPARRPTLKVDWQRWALEFGRGIPFDELYDHAGAIRPDRFDAYLDAEGVDVALLMSEYSPRVTGIQPVEDLLPLLEQNPRRFRLIANLNPHLHHPILEELDRQLALGAAAVKLHPVHGGFSPTEGVLYLVYQRCAELGVPVVFHTGTSTFPGAVNRFGDPAPIDELIQHVPDLTVVLAHGGRGWWYDAAAFLALTRPNVWIDLSGLPPTASPPTTPATTSTAWPASASSAATGPAPPASPPTPAPSPSSTSTTPPSTGSSAATPSACIGDW